MDDTAYIIIHGFAGDLSEVQYLKDFLSKNGLAAYGILLKGHGATKKDMIRYNYKHWIDHATYEVKEINKYHKYICLIGFSMGGLICVNIMQTVQVMKLILINTPIYFWNLNLIIKNIALDLKNNKKDHINFYLYSSSKAPFKSLIDFLVVLNKTKKMLCKVQVNTLILQCLDDDTVKEKSAKYIKDHLGANSTIKYYIQGGHQVLLSKTKDLVCEDVLKFV